MGLPTPAGELLDRTPCWLIWQGAITSARHWLILVSHPASADMSDCRLKGKLSLLSFHYEIGVTVLNWIHPQTARSKVAFVSESEMDSTPYILETLILRLSNELL